MANGTLKLLAVAVCAVSSIACTGAHPFPCELTVDPSFTDEEIEMIRSAADEWEIATGGIAHVEMTIEAQQPLKHFIERVVDEDEISRPKSSVGYSGIPYDSVVTRAPAVSISIFTRRIENYVASGSEYTYERMFRGVVLHEMGHHFGLDHERREGSLMYTKATTFCITTIDLAQFCSIHDCGGAPESVGSVCGTSWEDNQ